MTGLNIDKNAASITVGAHILLLLLCMFIGYNLPANPAPIEELGMEVNLGSSNNGSGDDQPFSTDNPAFQPEELNKQQQSESSNTPNEIATDEHDNDAATINTKKNLDKIKKDNNDNKANTTAQQKPKILYPAENGNGGNAAQINQSGGSEGNGTGNGDKGVAGGTAGAANYEGVPGNGGIGHSLSNRTIIAKPAVAAFNESGKVIIRVTVNREGIIINSRVKKTTDNRLSAIAIQELKQVRFSKSDKAPVEQFGDITFVFKTRSK